MNRRLIFVCLLLLAANSKATDYWVLGSFADKENALDEQIRLAEAVGAPISILYSPRQNSYRVVIDAAIIGEQELLDNHVEAWFMPDIIRAVEEPVANETEDPVPQSEVNTETADTTPSVPEPEWQPLYPPLNPGEDLIDYCERLPDSALCTDPIAESMLKKAKLLRTHQPNLSNPCAQIDNPKLKATCLEIQ